MTVTRSTRSHLWRICCGLALLIGYAAMVADLGAASAAAPDTATAAATYRDCDVCPLMTLIPAGSFEMGSDTGRAEERPRHPVAIAQPFAMGVYEITVDEWDVCLREGGCRHSPEQGLSRSMPMANVSWDDAQGFVSWLSRKTGRKYRLPTEAEWEYAARAGTDTRYWWGEAHGDARANCANCSGTEAGKGALPVGSYAANPYGLYDVHGNVWEWTEDCWNPSYAGAPADGTPWLRGDCVARVLRGGAWALDHEYMRASRRSRYDRDVRYYLHGFRVVSELPAVKDDTLPFAAAVQDAVHKVFAKAPPPDVQAPRALVIDPLVDGVAGTQSLATQAIGARMAELLRTHYPQYQIQELSAFDNERPPNVVIGTFTGVNKERRTSGERVAYRFCLSLLDPTAGTVTAKTAVFSGSQGVDLTPGAFFGASPVWFADAASQAYIDSCQVTRPGDPIKPLYLETLADNMLIGQAIDAYERGDLQRAHALFERAAATGGKQQLRTLNGLYLTHWGLERYPQAIEAFTRIAELGLDNGRFALKLPFKPGAADFLLDARAAQASVWLAQIARSVEQRADCLEVIGHTERGGGQQDGEALSLRRAAYVMRRLEAEVPALHNRMIATGHGAADNLVGSGTGDASDALDRRIEFASIACSPEVTGRVE